MQLACIIACTFATYAAETCSAFAMGAARTLHLLRFANMHCVLLLGQPDVTACPDACCLNRLYAVLQVDDNDVPVTKLVIRDAEVLWNPFDDLQPRIDKEDRKAAMADEAARHKQK